MAQLDRNYVRNLVMIHVVCMDAKTRTGNAPSDFVDFRTNAVTSAVNTGILSAGDAA